MAPGGGVGFPGIMERRAYFSIGAVSGALAALASACMSTAPPIQLHVTDDGSALGTTDAGSADDTGTPSADGGPTTGGDAADEAGTSSIGDAGADVSGTPPVDAADDGLARDAVAAEAAAPAPPTYEAESGAPFGQVTKIPCASCSNGQRVSLGPDSGFTLSNVDAPQAGTNTLVIYYTNADTKNRSIYVGVNGGDSQMLLAVFPPTGGPDNVSSLALPLSGFKAGSNNTLMLFIDTELPAPDLDRVGLAASTIGNGNGNPCDNASWKATASVTGGDGGGPAAGVDGDLKTRWASNRPQNGSDWYQVDFGALVKLARITLDNSQTFPNDYPGSYAVYASLDGVTFDSKPFASGRGTYDQTVIDFSQRTLRAIKITEVGSARAPNWWQIGELQVVCYR
jgi:hypothetical protein